MKINWKVRLKNPVFWGQVAVAIFLPILTHLGLSWEQITTWGALGNLLVQAIGNPVIVVAVIISVYNALIDPTTKGLGDSAQALTYDIPKSTEE
jgi:phi LC3 family holin